MKKNTTISIIALIFLCSCLCVCAFCIGLLKGTLLDRKHTYPRVAVVSAIDKDTDTVTVTDSVGYMWDFEGIEDWMIGDVVAMTMYDNCTEDIILDDEILKVHYTAFEIK